MTRPHPALVLFLAIASATFWTACSVEPEPIAYGSDACDFCRMSIVDKTHAAQLVTRKGKQYKYDAIECLVRNLPTREADGIATMLVANYGDPGTMTNARTATYLISPGIKSPMGANLSAFTFRAAAEAAKADHGGSMFEWDALPMALSGNQGSAHGE